MASFTKEIKQSVASTLQATTSVTQAVATTITKVATSATDVVDPTVGTIVDVASGIRAYSSDWLADVQNDMTLNSAKREAKTKALNKALKDEAVQAKIQEQADIAVLEDLFD